MLMVLAEKAHGDEGSEAISSKDISAMRPLDPLYTHSIIHNNSHKQLASMGFDGLNYKSYI